jgi:hypothetical protein
VPHTGARDLRAVGRVLDRQFEGSVLSRSGLDQWLARSCRRLGRLRGRRRGGRGRRGRERREAPALAAVERLAQRIEHSADRRRDHARRGPTRNRGLEDSDHASFGEHRRSAPALERGRRVELDLDPLRGGGSDRAGRVLLGALAGARSEHAHARTRRERPRVGGERAHAARLAREQEHQVVLAQRCVGVAERSSRRDGEALGDRDRCARAGQRELDALSARERLGRERVRRAHRDHAGRELGLEEEHHAACIAGRSSGEMRPRDRGCLGARGDGDESGHRRQEHRTSQADLHRRSAGAARNRA